MISEVAKLAGKLGGATIAAILVLIVITELPLSQLPGMVAFTLVGAVILAVPMVLWKRRQKAAKAPISR